MSIITSFFNGNKKSFKWFIVAIFILLVFAGGYLFHYYFSTKNSSTPEAQAVLQGKDSLINPSFSYTAHINPRPAEYDSLKEELSKFINDKISSGKANKISLYFRDLTKWGWVTINPTEKYEPASLMKVPTMIAILEYAQTHPEILSKKVFYDGNIDYNAAEDIKPLKQIQVGNYYTVDDLLFYMIAYSDNNAAQLLLHQLDLSIFYEVFTDLGLSTPPKSLNINNFDYMSVKSYALFFKVLYNATYLSKEMSEKALKLLLTGDFPQGIEAGVPEDVIAAQKFGESAIVDENNKNIAIELHDCGIIYYPNKPYLLCIMTSGSNFFDLENDISSLSSIVYKNISKK